MSTLVLISVVAGVWSVVFLGLLAACWAAQRGDEALMRDVRRPRMH